MGLPLIIVNSLIPLLLVVFPTVSAQNPCTSVTITDCGQCTKLPECVWCSDPKDFSRSRCLLRNERHLCTTKRLIDSQLNFTILQNIPLTDIDRKVSNPVQLSPQRVSITNVRVGQIKNISVQFRQAKDYPVDLYFLMDLSSSMWDDKENLERLGGELAETMQKITQNFTLGFGSFVDKNTFPFVNNKGPSCYIDSQTKEQNCELTYSFMNQLPLINNTNLFTNKVRRSKIVATYDTPEGGFDALLQAMVCQKDVGWRTGARHLIVFSTDADSHLAGDGRIGGILKPNDGKCHLKGGNYTEPLNQDYPSLGQIARAAKDEKMNIIFAIQRSYAYKYLNFENLIQGSKVGRLDSDSANVVTLVKEQYKAITSEVILSHTNATDGVVVRYFTRCLRPIGSPLTENRTCDGLGVGTTVDFTISIDTSLVNITECKNSRKQQTITISPIGLSETLIIDLEIICECPCERADNYTCPSLCKDFEPCVRCHQTYESEASESCLNDCQRNSSVIKEEGEKVDTQRVSERKCSFVDQSSGCLTEFVYGFNDEGDRQQVRYAGSPVCPPPLPITTIAFSLLGVVVAIGIGLLLLWRLLLYLYDRKEYARFIDESKNAKWNVDNNPLYVEASTTFVNPAFQEET